MNGHKIIIIRNFLFAIVLIIMICLLLQNLNTGHILPQAIDKPEETVSLRDPTYGEALWFLQQDPIDEREYEDGKYVCYHFAQDTVKSAEKWGIRCYLVIMFEENVDRGHAIVAFHTTDHGIQYFNPQSDKPVKPKDWVYG